MRGDLLKHDVADRMAARVVDLLEMIDVDGGDGDRGPAAPSLSQVGPHVRLHRAAIQAAREGIAADLLLEARVHGLKAARQQREPVRPPLATKVWRRRGLASLDDLAIHPEQVHPLAKTADRVDEHRARGLRTASC